MISFRVGCLALPLVMFGAWLGWTVVKVGGAPIIGEADRELAHYPCVGQTDELLPYSVKSAGVASRVYYSLGGENYVQAIWLIPLTRLALSIRYDRSRISKIYAATAGYGDTPKGYDAIATVLYRSNYCDLPRRRRHVVEFITHPVADLATQDPLFQRETDRAKQVIALYNESRRRSE